MKRNTARNRRSIRLKGYDYSQAGFYFVTICTKNKECVFGDISKGKMTLNEFGRIAFNEWNRNPIARDNIINHAFVVMPNHIHGIIEIKQPVGAYRDTPLRVNPNEQDIVKSRLQSPSNNLGAMVRGYKSAVTKRINQLRNSPGKPLWQRNYYEHIIRDQESLERITEYITWNPANWHNDRFFR